jgi:hypothetical protein
MRFYFRRYFHSVTAHARQGYCMNIDYPRFLAVCHAIDEAAEFDLSGADRGMLIALHKALSSLKMTVERALRSYPPIEESSS